MVALLASACTPASTSLRPYAGDEATLAALENSAAAACRCRRGQEAMPPRPFTTDGCSMSPDGDWVDCCVEHDIAYWCGGSRADRRRADRRLRDCVASKGHSRAFATFVRWTVLVGGQPCSPFPWRWGYGWDGVRGYEDGADAEGGCPDPLPSGSEPDAGAETGRRRVADPAGQG